MENVTKILRLPEVKNRTGLARSTIYQKILDGTFPAPVTLGDRAKGDRAVGWPASDIENWLQVCIAGRDAASTGSAS
jgi:prophage regulatory protein